ncbi:MAG: outer membrane beta-barrel protein [Bacteroidales bacterium]|nr:outer membrane beta-barrel protein [Bacteroidales bacterium]
MKKYLLLFLMLTTGLTSQSQILITLLLGDKLNSPGLEFGLEGGINWTTISGFETKDYARKWNLGFYFDIRIKNQWSLYTGVLVKSNMGIDKLTDNDLISLGASKFTIDGQEVVGDYSHKMNTFLVPALVRYRFKNHLYAELGPQFGLAYKSWIEFESDIEDKDIIIKDYNRDKINMIDAGIMAGVGYTMMKGTGWTIGAKYYYGFVDVYKDIAGTKNSSFFLKLNIPIGTGEKTKKKDKDAKASDY